MYFNSHATNKLHTPNLKPPHCTSKLRLHENMQDVIRKHNKSLLTKHAKQQNITNNDTNQQNSMTNDNTHSKCNCRQTQQCPLNENCLAKSVFYKPEITQDDSAETKTYVGATSSEFKTRYRNLTKSFRNQKYSQDTELSKHVWNLKKSQKSSESNGRLSSQSPCINMKPKGATCV